jgi:hypothetical protein
MRVYVGKATRQNSIDEHLAWTAEFLECIKQHAELNFDYSDSSKVSSFPMSEEKILIPSAGFSVAIFKNGTCSQ